jgi:dephospho-CoA kinase
MKQIIAIVGMPGSGKSVVTEYLKTKYDFDIIYFGGYILKEVKKQGLEISHENEKIIRERLRAEIGKDVIARLAYNDILKLIEKNKKIVIDGLYSFSEYMYFKQETKIDMKLIAIHSRMQKRIERLAGRIIRPLNKQEIEKRDLAEISSLEKGGPIAIADYHIVNDDTIYELYERVDDIIKDII